MPSPTARVKCNLHKSSEPSRATKFLVKWQDIRCSVLVQVKLFPQQIADILWQTNIGEKKCPITPNRKYIYKKVNFRASYVRLSECNIFQHPWTPGFIGSSDSANRFLLSGATRLMALSAEMMDQKLITTSWQR